MPVRYSDGGREFQAAAVKPDARSDFERNDYKTATWLRGLVPATTKSATATEIAVAPFASAIGGRH
jgi:hypothetical protein